MSRFFLRLLIWFWFTLAVALLAFQMVTGTLAPELPAERWERGVFQAATLFGQGLGDLWRQHGAQAARARLDLLETTVGIRGFLFDATGEERLGRSVSDMVRREAQKTLTSRSPSRSARGTQTLLVVPLENPPGVLVLQAEWPSWQSALPALILRVGAVLLVVGVMAWQLAHHISRPLLQLREAVRRFASGDMRARAPRQAYRHRDEIGALMEDFNAMADRMRGLLLSQRRLLGDVSHELRSPLTRASLALALAQKQLPEGAASLERVERELHRLEELVSSLLSLSSLNMMNRPARNDLVDLGTLVRQVAEDGAFEAEIGGKQVEAHLASGIWVRGDESLLRSALENVVRNALRYAPGGTSVGIDLRREPSGARPVRLAVRDWGPGVPDGDLGSIFRPFVRSERARERTGEGGAGLGLAIAARAVKLHRGIIRAENPSGGGLRVEMALPAADPPEDFEA